MPRLLEILFYLSILLCSLPTFFLVNTSLNSINLTVFLWIILFSYIALQAVINKKNLKTDKPLIIFFLIFFLCQSLSIINTHNLDAFLASYKDLISTSIFFMISIFVIQTKKNIYEIIFVLLIGLIINFLFQILILLNLSLFISLTERFLYPPYFELILANIDRGRIFLTNYDEALIPIIFYLIFTGKDLRKNILGVISITLIVLFSLIVGFRTKILMSISALLGSLFIFKDNLGKDNFNKVIMVVMFIVISTYILLINIPFLHIQTGLERFISVESNQELSTGRTYYWFFAYNMGVSSPLTGVGLGNYYDNLPNHTKQSIFVIKSEEIRNKAAIYDPHNIFFRILAETGFTGLISFLTLLIYFAINDIKILFNKNDLSKTFCVSFWTLFVFSLFNPSTSITYMMFFWLFRAIIAKSNAAKIQTHRN